MKNTTILILIVVVIATLGFVIARDGNGNSVTGNAISNPPNNQNNGEQAQRIVLSTKNYNYYPDTIKVKAGQPVSISLDDKVYGCLRAFTIKDLGISKYLKTAQDVLDFTPTKKGTFTFSCSMGMGFGKLIVE